MTLIRHIFILLLVLAAALQAQTDLIDPSYQGEDNLLQFQLSAAKQNYVESEPILVKLTIRNITSEPQTISSFPEAALTYELNIFDSDRRLMRKRKEIRAFQKSDLKPGLKDDRTVTLYPGEEFSVSVDLNNWYEITNIGRYQIQAWFNSKDEHRKIFSNPLNINLKPSGRIIARLQIEDVLAEEERLTTMTPEGTVTYMLGAMKDQDWESAFKYMDFAKLMWAYAPYGQDFRAAVTDEEKQAVVDRFKNWFKNDWLYAHVGKFKLQNVVYPNDPKERIVYCFVGYEKKVNPNDFLYTFSLRQKGNKWYLYNVESLITRMADWGEYDRTVVTLDEKNKEDQRYKKMRQSAATRATTRVLR